VRDFVETAFGYLGLDWTAHVDASPGIRVKSGSGVLRGDSARLEFTTGWRPATSFEEMIRKMVDAEIQTTSDSR
jgi:GDPmannose 4,6-dehydratase